MYQFIYVRGERRLKSKAVAYNDLQLMSEAEQNCCQKGEASAQISNQPVDAPKRSSRISNYAASMKKHYQSDINEQALLVKFQADFEQYRIAYRRDRPFQQNISLSVVKESVNSEVIVFLARWGYFQVQLWVLNVAAESQAHGQSSLEGSYGKIYFGLLQRQTFIIKCIHFKVFKCPNEAKIMAIKEYVLLKIAAALGVGPQVAPSVGFDMMMHSNCVEFLMEDCEKVDNITEEYEHQLKKDLFLLHSFHFVHLDIKPLNIMFSHARKKAVFIDFGLSQVIPQGLGFKHKTMFRGTLDYCSNEMLKAFNSGQPEEIDLYYNDVFCLDRSILQQRERPSRKKVGEYQFDCQDLGLEPNTSYEDSPKYIHLEKMLLFTIKYLLFQEQTTHLHQIFEQNSKFITDCLMGEILHFFYQLHPSEKLRIFYQAHLQTHHRQGIEFNKLNQIYESKFINFRTVRTKENKKEMFKAYYSDLMEIANDDDFNSFNKAAAMKMLLEGKSEMMKDAVYFKNYLKLVSFSDNGLGVSKEERWEAVRLFYEKFNKEMPIDGKNISKLEMVKTTFVFMLSRWISPVDASEVKESSFRADWKKFIFALLEQAFLLKIFSTDKLIQSVEGIFQTKYFDYFDRLELILYIHHISQWLIHRIPKTNRIGYSEQHDLISNWCFLKCKTLEKQNSIFAPFTEYLRASICRDVEKVKSNTAKIKEYFVLLPASLILEIKIEILYFSLGWVRAERFNHVVSELLMLIPYQQKSKMHFFHFKIFEIYSEMMNYDKCNEIYSLMLDHFRCEQLVDSFTLKYKINIMQHKNMDLFLSSSVAFFDRFSFDFLRLQHIVLSHMALRLYAIRYNKNRFYVLSRTEKEMYKLAVLKLSEIVRILQLSSCFQIMQKSTTLFHNCIAFDLLGSIINIKKCFFKMIDYLYSETADLEFIKEKSQTVTCQNCRTTLINFYLHGRQNHLLSQLGKVELDVIQPQFEANYKQIIAINCEKNEDFVIMNLYSMFQLCAKARCFEPKHNGILNFYNYIKSKKMFYFFFQYKPQCTKLLYFTMLIIHQRISQTELALFLLNLTENIKKHYSSFSVFLLIFVFQNFAKLHQLNFIGLLNQIQSIESLRLQKNQQASYNVYNVIYFNIGLFYVNQDIYQRKFINKIVSCIDLLPFDIQIFMETQIYRFIVFRQHGLGMRKRRNTEYFVKKIVKLSNSLGSTVIQIKNKESKLDKIYRSLQKKALLLGGPYEMNLQNIKPIFVRPRCKR